MDPAAAIAHLEREGRLLAAAAREAGVGADVPTCPGWTVADLLVHTATVFRHKTHVLEHRLQDRPAGLDGNVDDPEPAGAPAFYDEELTRVVSALTGLDPSTEVWTFTADRTVGFWCRRMAHEAAIHRADAQAALGPVDALPRDLALDGVDEILDVFLAPRVGGLTGLPATVHLHATDAAGDEGEWLVHLGPGGVLVERGHAKGDAALRGTASDLDLWLWGRAGDDVLEHFGEAESVRRLRSLATGAT